MKEFNFPYYGLLLIPMILVLAIFLLKSRFRNIPLYLLFFLQFTKGVNEYTGLLSPNMTNFISELIIISLFIKVLLIKRRIPKYFTILLAIIIFSFFSFYINATSLIDYFLFIRRISILLILIIYFKEEISFKGIKYFESFLYIVFIYQILTSIFKLFIYGPAEEFIGTLSVGEGSLTTNFALIGISFCIIHYLRSKKLILIAIALLLVIFILAGNKRAPLFYIPIIILLIIYFFNKYLNPSSVYILKTLSLGLIFLIISIFAILRYNKTLNPDDHSGVDLEYAQSYIYEYATEKGSGNVEGYGRAVAPRAVFSRVLADGKINLFVGLGPGILIPSSFKSSKTKTDHQIFISKFNIGYGGRIGFLWFILQVGVLGMILFLIFHFNQVKYIIRTIKFKSLPYKYKYELLLALICYFIFFIDFFTYSQVMFKINAVTLLFAYIVGTRTNRNFYRSA